MKRRKLRERLLSYLLCLAMVIALVPMNALTVRAEGGSNTTFEYGDYKILMLSGYIDNGDGNFSCQGCEEPVFKNYNPESDYADLLSGVGVHGCWNCADEGIHFGITMKTPLPNASPCPHCCKGKVCSGHDNIHCNERYDIQSECYFPCRANSDNEECCGTLEHGCQRLDITCEYCRGTGIDPYCTHTHHFVYVHKVDASGKDYHSSECDDPDCRKRGDLPYSGYDCNTDGTDGACSVCGFKAEAPAHTHTKGTYHAPVAATCTNPGVVEYWECSGCDKNINDSLEEITDVTISATGIHDFSVKVDDATHKCANCDATESHDLEDEIVITVNIDEKEHHLKYDDELYFCQDEGCDAKFVPGYYNAYGSCEENDSELAYVLLANKEDLNQNIEYDGCLQLQVVDFRNIEEIEGFIEFKDCKLLQTVNLGRLQKSKRLENAIVFENCPSLQSVDLKNLTEVVSDSLGIFFDKCGSLETIDLGSLKNAGGDLDFRYCDSLETIDLGSLKNVGGHLDFRYCDSLRAVDLGKLVNCGDVTYSSAKAASVTLHEGDPCGIKIYFWDCVISYTSHTYILDEEGHYVCSVCGHEGGCATGNHDFSNGICTVCGYKLARVDEVSLTLSQSDIGINFYFEGLDSLVDTGAYVSLNGIKNKISSANADKQWGFSSYVAAKEMGDKINVAVYDKDDQLIALANESAEEDGSFKYSVNDYLSAVKSDDSISELAKAMLNYGLCSQDYFGYNAPSKTPDIATVSYREYDVKTEGTLPEGVTYVGSSLLLNSKTTIRHYFKTNGNTVNFKIEGNPVTATTIGNMCYVEVKDIKAVDLDKAYEVTVSDESSKYTLKYSAMSYCQKANSVSTDSKLKTLADSLYWYCVAAKEYFK